MLFCKKKKKNPHSDSKEMYCKTDIIKMFEVLINNIFVMFGLPVFRQTASIPMRTNCAPLVAELFLC